MSYSQDAVRPILEQNMNPNGDASLLFQSARTSAIVEQRTLLQVFNRVIDCWCSNFVAGEWTKHLTDCNIPCTGDKNSFCGGRKALNVFEALANHKPTTTMSVTSLTGAVNTTIDSSGAVKNAILLEWWPSETHFTGLKCNAIVIALLQVSLDLI
jgi:hypothetical protein